MVYMFVFCTDDNFWTGPYTEEDIVPWCDYLDTLEESIDITRYEGHLITDDLIDEIMKLFKTSNLECSERLDYLQNNKGRYLWFLV